LFSKQTRLSEPFEDAPSRTPSFHSLVRSGCNYRWCEL